jgi:hypothetical protein
MKRSTYLFGILVLLLLQTSCKQNPLSEVESGDWNNERSVLGIKFENQVGSSDIERIDEATGEISITINANAVPNLSNIVLEEIQLSYEAESSVQEGDALNFENANNSASITVTSPTGKSREYTITASSFTESLLGTYNITGFTLWGGTGPEYDGGEVIPFEDKPWIWPENGGPNAELDNTVTFTLGGITEDGNTFGTIINDSGEDGNYADFIFSLDPQTDVNDYYRTLPKGDGEWSRNYNNGTISITFEDGSTHTGSFETSGTENLGNGYSFTIEEYALAFDLNGVDDWDNIYSDYDKVVINPRRYWIELSKQ